MIIKPSAALRNDYLEISTLAKQSQAPIYITKNGEGDLVVLSIEAFERREELLKLRTNILKAEEERIMGASVLSVAQARAKLKERVNDL